MGHLFDIIISWCTSFSDKKTTHLLSGSSTKSISINAMNSSKFDIRWEYYAQSKSSFKWPRFCLLVDEWTLLRTVSSTIMSAKEGILFRSKPMHDWDPLFKAKSLFFSVNNMLNRGSSSVELSASLSFYPCWRTCNSCTNWVPLRHEALPRIYQSQLAILDHCSDYHRNHIQTEWLERRLEVLDLNVLRNFSSDFHAGIDCKLSKVEGYKSRRTSRGRSINDWCK